MKSRVLDRIHHDEFPTVRAEFEAAHPPKPTDAFRPVCGGRRAPAVLRELRAETAAPSPTALREAFDRPVHTWLPTIGLRSVPLVSIDGNIAAIRAIHAAHPDAGNALLDVPGALNTLAEIRMLLEVAK